MRSTVNDCPICGDSRDPATAVYEHRRLGLDEPPFEAPITKQVASNGLVPIIYSSPS